MLKELIILTMNNFKTCSVYVNIEMYFYVFFFLFLEIVELKNKLMKIVTVLAC